MPWGVTHETKGIMLKIIRGWRVNAQIMIDILSLSFLQEMSDNNCSFE